MVDKTEESKYNIPEQIFQAVPSVHLRFVIMNFR